MSSHWSLQTKYNSSLARVGRPFPLDNTLYTVILLIGSLPMLQLTGVLSGQIKAMHIIIQLKDRASWYAMVTSG